MQKIKVAVILMLVQLLMFFFCSYVHAEKFTSDDSITRIEFAKLINETFSFIEKTGINFKDIQIGSIHEDEVKKAVTAGYMLGYGDETFRPESKLNRQEAATIIFRLMRLEMNPDINIPIKDLENNSELSREIIKAVIESGYMNTNKNCFEPSKNMSWTDAEKLLQKLTGTVINEAGIYTQESTLQVEGNVTVGTAGIKLCNKIIKGSLFITAGTGDGIVELENVNVQGKTIICGGSKLSVLKKSLLDSVIVDKKVGGTLTLSVFNSSKTGKISIRSETFLNEEDVTGLAFGEITIDPGIRPVERVTVSGDFTVITVNAAGLNLVVKEGTMIGTIVLNAKASVTGTGIIGTVNINAADCKIEQSPGRINYKIGQGS